MFPDLNKVLHIQVHSIDEEEEERRYQSRVVDTGDTELFIEIPLDENNGRYKKLYIGDGLSLSFLGHDGIDHFFNSTVLGFREEAIPQVAIRKPAAQEISRVQRRHFFRVPASLEISVTLQDGLRVLTVTEDVSGGGVSFHLDAHVPISQGTNVICWLLVPYKNGKVEHVKFTGEVLRIRPARGKLLCMVQFIGITEKDRQRLMRFCFERQIEFRKN